MQEWKLSHPTTNKKTSSSSSTKDPPRERTKKQQYHVEVRHPPEGVGVPLVYEHIVDVVNRPTAPYPPGRDDKKKGKVRRRRRRRRLEEKEEEKKEEKEGEEEDAEVEDADADVDVDADADADADADVNKEEDTDLNDLIKPTTDIDEKEEETEEEEEEAEEEEEEDTSDNTAIPIFWHIERSGGSSITRVLGSCLSLVQASAIPSFYNHPLPTMLSVARISDQKYVTVDLTAPAGIHHAKNTGLLTTFHYLTDLIVTHMPYTIAQDLLDGEHKGRLFVLLRHPIHMALSLFNHLQHLPQHHPQFDGTLKNMQIHDWVLHHPTFPDNILLRTILGYNHDPFPRALTEVDLNTAKYILKTKVIIGLLEQKGPSMERFMNYFMWDDHSPFQNQARVDECMERALHWGWYHKSPPSDYYDHFRQEVMNEESSLFLLMKQKNMFDFELYEYAKYLFWWQGMELELD